MTKKQKLQNEARKHLLTLINPDTKLLIIIKSVSPSGMCRRMKVILPDFQDITYQVADLCDLSINDKGLKITGSGMDMTFWLANYITNRLYGKEKPKGLKGNGGTCLEWTTI